MMKSTKIALVVAFAVFAAPAAMARPHSAHVHAASHATQVVPAPGYGHAGPFRGSNWGSECVTDDGQGRFFPCD